MSSRSTNHQDRMPLVASASSRSKYKKSGIGNSESIPVLPDLDELAGDSEPVRRIRQEIPRIARCDLTVLITGEVGVGKRAIGRVIHDLSKRMSGPFIEVWCDLDAQELLHADLFRYEQSTLTVTVGARDCLFEQAHGGTIFFKDIERLPLDVQTRLFRVLNDQSEGRGPAVLDARVIAATTLDLYREVQEKRFHEGLYYMLSILVIDLPPLRERGIDLLVLADRYLRRFKELSSEKALSLSPDAIDAFRRYSWPGNVVELHHTIKMAMMLEEGDQITAASLPRVVVKGRSKSGGAIRYWAELRDGESLQQHLMRVVLVIYKLTRDLCDGHAGAARKLKIKRTTLYSLLERARKLTTGLE